LKAFTAVLFIICLNVAGLIAGNLMTQNILATGEVNDMPYTIEEIENMFNPFSNFSVYNILYGLIGAGIAGLLGLITRSGTFAIYAVILFIVGLFLNVFEWVLFGLPKFTSFLVAGTGLEWLTAVVTMFVCFIFFWFIVELLAQRQLMT